MKGPQMFRSILLIVSSACLIALVFTDLDIWQRLLLTGAVLYWLVDDLSELIAARRK